MLVRFMFYFIFCRLHVVLLSDCDYFFPLVMPHPFRWYEKTLPHVFPCVEGAVLSECFMLARIVFYA